MKIIVTHSSPDLDAVTSVWLLKRFLPGWEDAKIKFVPAGERLKNLELKIPAKDPLFRPSFARLHHETAGTRQGRQSEKLGIETGEDKNGVEKAGEDEIIHVDTGFGKFDHHDTSDMNVSAASLVYDYICQRINYAPGSIKKEALCKMVEVVVSTDHFQELFYQDALAAYHEFSLLAIIEGLKMEYPGHDQKYVEFTMECLNAILRVFENRIWAEHEIKEKGIEFKTQWGKALAVETNNDTVLKLGQKMGYEIVVRKDPRNGFVRIKARPENKLKTKNSQIIESELRLKTGGVDLTKAYNRFKKLDPYATWFLHVSKRMLLNGSSKNPKMIGTNLALEEIVKVLKDE